jgi:hypothetical protein
MKNFDNADIDFENLKVAHVEEPEREHHHQVL